MMAGEGAVRATMWPMSLIALQWLDVNHALAELTHFSIGLFGSWVELRMHLLVGGLKA